MCRTGAVEIANLFGYAGAAIDLWVMGNKKAAAWLVWRAGYTLQSYREFGMSGEALAVLSSIYAYADKMRERADRRTAKFT